MSKTRDVMWMGKLLAKIDEQSVRLDYSYGALIEFECLVVTQAEMRKVLRVVSKMKREFKKQEGEDKS